VPAARARAEQYGIQLREKVSGSKKFEQVPEAELLERLKQGWNITQKMEDGSYIVSIT